MGNLPPTKGAKVSQMPSLNVLLAIVSVVVRLIFLVLICIIHGFVIVVIFVIIFILNFFVIAALRIISTAFFGICLVR
jgi:hypothetical protein